MKVIIYLRAIKRGRNYHLAMFDSNRQGNIDDLITEAKPGDTINWVLDSNSGIEKIVKIYCKERVLRIFKEHKSITGEFVLHIPHNANAGLTKSHKEKYFIECSISALRTQLTIDPYIKIPPPPTSR